MARNLDPSKMSRRQPSIYHKESVGKFQQRWRASIIILFNHLKKQNPELIFLAKNNCSRCWSLQLAARLASDVMANRKRKAQPQAASETWKCGVEIEESAMNDSSVFHLFQPRQQDEQLGSRWAIIQRYCLDSQLFHQIHFHSSMGFDTQTLPVRSCCLSSISSATVPDTVAGLSRTDSSFASLLWPVVAGPP